MFWPPRLSVAAWIFEASAVPVGLNDERFMPRKLKVFRTPIGFHDAYVAASSQKAALAAWGADANLFARGSAEEVVDPALTMEPLDRPGEIVKKLRGTIDEHLAALPDAPLKKERVRAGKKAATAAPKPAPQQPKPDRNDLDDAEAALSAAEEERDRIIRSLADREKALARERRKIERDQAETMQRLEAERDEAAKRYEAALAKWRRVAGLD